MIVKIIQLISILIMLSYNFGENIVGEYRLTGLNVVDYDFCRQNTDIKVVEKSGFSLDSLTVYTIQQGENIDYDVREPYPLFALNAAGVELFVYFAEDGTATILEGSTYPTESAGEGCFTEEIALPVQEDFSYTVDLNSSGFIPVLDILGLQSYSPYKGQPAGAMGISGSSILDIVPANPTNVSIPFPIDTSSVFNDNNGVISADTILPGMTAGYVIKSSDMYSFIDYLAYDPNGFFFNENNPPNRPSLYLEWHAIDGPVNESGLGDFVGEDEDGDGTDFDSIYGLSKIKITKVYSTNECGLNSYDIAGDNIESLRIVKYNQCINDGNSDPSLCHDVADNWIETCIDVNDVDDEGNNLYVMNLSQDPNFNWGGYVTWNSIRYNTTQDDSYLFDDSNENFNSSCMDDDDFSDCSGRIIFEYFPQCIPSFNMRYFMAEFEEQCQETDKDECGVCFGYGIPNGYCDCYFGYKEDCNGVCDADPTNDDLSCFGCNGIANSGLEYDCAGVCGGETYFDCAGVCGGTSSYDSNNTCCENELLDCAGYCNGVAIVDACGTCGGTVQDTDLDGICDTEDDCPEIPNPDQNDNDEDLLADACDDDDDDGDGLIDCWNFWFEDGILMTEEEIMQEITLGNCEDFALSVEKDLIPQKINLSKAYPNPFNPIINFDIEINHFQYIQLNIYSINGNLVANLYNGKISPGEYQLSWDGTAYSSGIYIVSLHHNNGFENQKIILLK